MILVKSVKYVTSLLLLLPLLFLAVVWWGLSTDDGTKQILAATQKKLGNLRYEYVSGNLLDGLVLRNAEWQLKNGTLITGNHLEINSNPNCWQSKKICIDSGTIDRLTINLPAKKPVSNEIKLKSLSLLLAIETSDVHVGELVFKHPAMKPISFTEAEFSGSITESRINLTHFNTRWKALSLQGTGALTMRDDYPVDLEGSITRSFGDLVFHSNWNTSGDLKNLVLDSAITKPFNAKLNGVISLLDRRRPADMTLQWQEMAMPFKSEKPAVQINKGSVNIKGNWPAYNAKGTALIEGEHIPAGELGLNGILTTKQIAFAPLTINTLDGSADGRGVFSWSDGIRWNVDYQAQQLNPGSHWPGLTGDISGTVSVNGELNEGQVHYRFDDIDLKGTLNDRAITTTGSIGKNETGWIINRFNLNNTVNHISANGGVGDSIKLVFSVADAQSLIPEAHGDLHGELIVNGEIKNPTLKGSITSAALRYKNIALKNAKVEGIARDFGNDYSDLTFRAANIHIDERHLMQPDMQFHGTRADHIIEITGSTEPLNAMALNIIGTFDEHRNWNGTVNSAKSLLADRPLRLTRPFTAVWIQENQTLAVEPHCWRYDFASVCIKESALIGKTGVVKFALDQLPLESIAEFIPSDVQVSGILRSSGELTWGPNQNPTASINSYVENATARLREKLNKKQLTFDIPVARLNITSNGYQIKSHLRLQSDKFSEVTADINMNTALRSYPISGDVFLSDTELDWVKDFLPDINLLNGTLGGKARIAGALFDPKINAQIRLKNGQVRSELLPIDIKNIDVAMNIDGKDATVTGSAQANNADVKISGTGSLTDTGLTSDLSVIGKEIKFEHEYAENVIISPNLTFRINEELIDVAGTVDVPRATITLQSLNNDGVILSDDIIVVDNQESSQKQSTVGAAGFNTRVNISLGEQVSVDSYGLKADLGGNFTFALASERPPSVTGQIDVSNGNYKAYGQQLKIRNGLITFTGPIEQTALAIEAVREIKDVNAGVRINGTLKSPTTSLFSEPPMPEEDILPIIVLGRSLDLERDDASLLRKAALLLGVNTGQRISSKLASELGIDDFSLSAWGTGDDTQILVSGRINDRLVLRYGVGVFKNNNSLYLRYDLAEKLYLETSKGLESAVDIFYTFDF